MYKKLICLIFFILVLAASTKLQAQVVLPFFSDDFDMTHDYVADNVEGTGWDGFVSPGETVDALNASIDRAGELYVASISADWGGNNRGPFLYKIVEGDFIATVKVSDYAYTPNTQGYDNEYYHNNCGLMARASIDPCDVAGTGEDWVSIDYFPIWTCGNFVRTNNDGVRTEHGHNGQYRRPLDDPNLEDYQGIELCDPYLQLERSGNTFHFRTSADGVTWTEMAPSPLTRDDLDDLPLQVGLFECTYFANLGYAAFDNFSIKIVRIFKAYNPVPDDEAQNVDPNADLTWSPGSKAKFHDVYFGTNETDVANGTGGTYMGQQSETTYDPGPLDWGTTYYWRIDEVNEPNSWPGDIWSFTVMRLEASNPSPPDGADCVSVDADLSWIPGALMKFQDIYFGTVSPPPKVRSNHTLPYYTLPTLEYDTTYYWKVDTKKLIPPPMETWPGEEWSFRTAPFIPIADPNLVGWWKLDGECDGTVALDSSGYDHHGVLGGDPQWVTGYEGRALQFDGKNDYVELPIGSVIGQLSSCTVTTWMDSRPGGPWQRLFDFGFGTDDPNVYMYLSPRYWFMDPMVCGITTGGFDAEFQAQRPAGATPTGWHHVAMTIDEKTHMIRLYLDGVQIASGSTALLPKDLGNTTNNWLGKSHDPNDGYFLGILDDFRIYSVALTEAEIPKTMRGNPLLAWDPKPGIGSTLDEEQATPLSWSSGDNAAQHDVYFSTDFDDVNDANTLTAGIYQGRQLETTYTPSEALQWGQTYYWRIDEYNTGGTITKGRIWSFTVANYLVVDNFEDYNNFTPDKIFQTWKDGLGYPADGSLPEYGGNETGSAVGSDVVQPPGQQVPWAEQSIVNSGVQSMPVKYVNDGSTGKALYSEIFRQWDEPQDWTRKDVKSLALWFRGYPASEGSYTLNGGVFTVIADGAGITGTADEFHLVYKKLTGTGTADIIAKVVSIDSTNAEAKAGVMIRDSLDADSSHAFMCLTPSRRVSFENRPTYKGASQQGTSDVNEISFPHWVRLYRDIGNVFTAYYSTNGTNWEQVPVIDYTGATTENPEGVPMSDPVYIGLAFTSGVSNTYGEAVFSNVQLTGNVSGEWQSRDVPSNDAEQLYIAVEDSSNNIKVIDHPNPNAVLLDTWTEWPIDPGDLSGVNLQAVKKMYIGIGDRDNPISGGFGKLFIDDIRLHRQRCMPSLLKPLGDFSNDCVVDYFDLEIMANAWLVGDQIIETINPGTVSLVGHWKLDETSGTVAVDSSINANHGTLRSGPKWVAGYDDGALEFDGRNDYVELPIGSLISSLTSSTFATWVDFSNDGGGWQRIFDFGMDPNINMWLTPRMGTTDPMRFAITTEGSTAEFRADTVFTLPSGWHHVAVTISDPNSEDTRTIRLYVDGAEVGKNTQATLSPTDLGETTNNWLGRSEYEGDAYFMGTLDDFRIYSRELTQAEIAYLADSTPGDGQCYTPVLSEAELYSAEPQGSRAVNFRDFALLVDRWLEEVLWPQP